jgi:hypothetical protein
MFFSNINDAVVWLHCRGWRQDDSGEWLKGNRRADIRRSPANDGVVSVVFQTIRTPQVAALPGMTPLGIKPRKA